MHNDVYIDLVGSDGAILAHEHTENSVVTIGRKKVLAWLQTTSAVADKVKYIQFGTSTAATTEGMISLSCPISATIAPVPPSATAAPNIGNGLVTFSYTISSNSDWHDNKSIGEAGLFWLDTWPYDDMYARVTFGPYVKNEDQALVINWVLKWNQ